MKGADIKTEMPVWVAFGNGWSTGQAVYTFGRAWRVRVDRVSRATPKSNYSFCNREPEFLMPRDPDLKGADKPKAPAGKTCEGPDDYGLEDACPNRQEWILPKHMGSAKVCDSCRANSFVTVAECTPITKVQS